ncbi:MAG: S49 family peptidase [Anaerolineaceae bacterium]|nr:S49 family peptidase [Anaerolineaceae bacterium]
MNDTATPGRWAKRKWLLFLILPLIIGIALAFVVPQPIVGVIQLNDAIYTYSARDLIAQITYARDHKEVLAVVLVIDSPGGTVSGTESVYMELTHLRQTKPVVMMIEGMAASGGYYLAAGSDYVMANPSSMVGNVGVIGFLPMTPIVIEDIYSTGPYKMWGFPRDTFVRQMDMIKENFLQVVLLGRGEALKMTPEQLLRGEIYPGSEALRLGLIDTLGSQSLAVEHAARMAHISNYRVENLRKLAGLPEIVFFPFFFENPEGVITPYPREHGIYLLYVPPGEKFP